MKIINLIIFFIFSLLDTKLIYTRPFMLMLYPSVSINNGRKIENEFENAIALDWALALKHALINQFPFIQVEISHKSGEKIDQIESINNINKQNPDLTISFNLYQTNGVPQVYLYYMLSQVRAKSLKNLDFVPYNQAYIDSLEKTKDFSEKIFNSLKENRSDNYELKKLLGLPYKPLIGLQSPALGIELGTNSTKGWEITINSLILAIKNIIF